MIKKQKRVAVSGYFDPLHPGHLEYFRLAKKIAGKKGKLIVILNNDKQALLKKPKVFMSMEKRKKILESLRDIDEVYISIDTNKSVCKSLIAIHPDIFAKGGDRFKGELLEDNLCKKLGIKIIDKLGKKIDSSSEIIIKWEKQYKEEHP